MTGVLCVKSDDYPVVQSLGERLPPRSIRHIRNEEPIDSWIGSVSGLLILADHSTPEMAPMCLQAVRHGVPTGVLLRQPLCPRTGELIRSGARWVGSWGSEDDLLDALSRITSIPVERSAQDRSWIEQAGLVPRDYQQFSTIVTRDPVMLSIMAQAELVATTDQTVLISGETGTGKDLLARAVHRVSGVRGRFVAVNVSGLDDALFADTLFGHLRGSYTGADRERAGLIWEAREGTLFLDEIGDLSPASQAKLLRLLQNREFYPIGADRPRTTSARFVVASHKDLSQEVAAGRFRSDLYYRLRVHELRLPTLRARRDDLELLARHFLASAAIDQGRRAPFVGEGFLRAVHAYSFPGNVRELRGIMHRAVAVCKSGVLRVEDFSPTLNSIRCSFGCPDPEDGAQTLFPTTLPGMKAAINQLLDEALLRAEGNQSAAARLLKVSPSAVNKRLREQRAFSAHSR